MHHLPNVLTALRIALTPVVAALMLTPTLAAQTAAVACFMVASASDYLDGVLARRWQVRSRLGQFLDPLADKLLLLGTLGMLAALEPQAVPWWAVVLIAARDAVVTALRSRAEAQGRTLRTFEAAKAKTLLQIAFAWGLLVLRALAHAPAPLGDAATRALASPVPFATLLVVLAVTLGTGALYVLWPQEERLPG
jgi:CDP-diacylglycerol--glycerol-3-phosphate 3-phosphatidyltransferase